MSGDPVPSKSPAPQSTVPQGGPWQLHAHAMSSPKLLFSPAQAMNVFCMLGTVWCGVPMSAPAAKVSLVAIRRGKVWPLASRRWLQHAVTCCQAFSLSKADYQRHARASQEIFVQSSSALFYYGSIVPAFKGPAPSCGHCLGGQLLSPPTGMPQDSPWQLDAAIHDGFVRCIGPPQVMAFLGRVLTPPDVLSQDLWWLEALAHRSQTLQGIPAVLQRRRH